LILVTLLLIGGIFVTEAAAQAGAPTPENFVVRGPSGAPIPEDFEAASPSKGLWKGWPVGSTVTVRQAFSDPQFNVHAVQFNRVLLVGRLSDGTAVIAGYEAASETGPWKFTQSASEHDSTGFLHEPGLRQVSERADKLVVGGKPVDCVVRAYDGVLQTQWHVHVSGEVWTIGRDGPPIKSSGSSSYEIGGQKFGNTESVTCTGQEKLAVGTQEITAIETVEEQRMDGKPTGGKTHRFYAEKVPGWLVCLRSWNQSDERQPPNREDDLLAFGNDNGMLSRYLKTDRPPEAAWAKLSSRPRPTTHPSSAPSR
jgi:hypothetical protein